MKGAIELREFDQKNGWDLDGEVFVKGNAEQQQYLVELIKEFTSAWT